MLMTMTDIKNRDMEEMQFDVVWNKILPVWDHTNFGLFVGLMGQYIQQRESKAHKTKHDAYQNLGSIANKP